MKKSNKLTAAGTGLLIAAIAGFAPAFADDGSNNKSKDDSVLGNVAAPLDETDEDVASIAESIDATEEAAPAEEEAPEEVAEATPEEDLDGVGTVAGTDSVDKADSTEVASSEETSSTEEQVSPEAEGVAGVSGKEDVTEEPSNDVSQDEVSESPAGDTESTASEAPEENLEEVSGVKPVDGSAAKEETPSVAPVAPTEKSVDITAPEAEENPVEIDVTKTNEPTEFPTVRVEAEAAPREAAPVTKAKSQSPAEKKTVVPVKVVPVVYKTATSSLATVRSVDMVGKVSAAAQTTTPTVVKPQQLGPVLLTEAASEVPTTPGTVNVNTDTTGAQTTNGQSMVVWFELPPAEGPSLQPGEVTTPLLGSAVTESAVVSTNVIPAAEVAPQEPPSGTTATATASAAVPVAAATTVQERGAMARTLARTGSLAQYAAMLSAVAMVIGVGMLIGAAAARRKQEN